MEVFQKILKSGCKAEESKLRTAPASGQSGLGLLHPELAGLLDDDAQSLSSRRVTDSPTD